VALGGVLFAVVCAFFLVETALEKQQWYTLFLHMPKRQ
jgi:hypothetical protein